ncbi:MAG: sugar ABC transporter ATP-binding protein, partial [Chloroflexi bacterium]|nr:sugar ABC transporter ATP-binding protein [Chloroflexota bacterium]
MSNFASEMTETDTILKMQGIVKDFPGVRALDRVDFDLLRGEIHALVGENGAGKSTLIKVLTGVYSKDRGEIFIRGKQVNILSTKASQNLGVACIYQELNLVPYFNVAQNIYLGIEPLTALGKIDWTQMYKGANDLLKDLGVELNLHMPVRKLGMGQRQMVIIARALLRNPAILILDEPTAMLTRGEIKYLFDLLKRLKEQGVGILYISHRMEEVFEIADRITVMRDGMNVSTCITKET